MLTSRFLRLVLWHCLAGLAIVVLPMMAAGQGRAAARDRHELNLSYVITIAGMRIGGISVGGTFADSGYAIALRGSAGGITRRMADTSAWMAANGTIRGAVVLPDRFEFGMQEDGVSVEAQMRLADGGVTDLHVVPGLQAGLDIVPLTIDHVQGVVDPMSAFFAPFEDGSLITGEDVCSRTLPIFDGRQRYDLSMVYRHTETLSGARAPYSGPAFTCEAVYLPIAGHSLTRSAVPFMSGNMRFEAQLIPITELGVAIPFRLQISTEIGDLIIRLDRIEVR